ncbi:hypothetical protein [Mesorhizobium sp. M0146]|uniref:hypothetical protein n=1 Tax=unclassified Mesorhizobium TaxID=325217 RepID=UPI00333CDCAA
MAEEPTAPTIDVHYLKSKIYREVSCDGAVGGPTPTNKIWIGFYSERLPVPRVVRHQLLATETEGEFVMDPNAQPVPIEARTGIVRNIEFGLYLTPAAAKTLHEWLGIELAAIKGEESK